MSSSRRLVPIALLLMVASIAGAALLLIGNTKANDKVHDSGVKLTADEARGRELFGLVCSRCHTLAAANAVGRTGPNLDLFSSDGLPASFVLTTIRNGVDDGEGNMPAGLYFGDDARDVAAFVAAVTQGEHR